MIVERQTYKDVLEYELDGVAALPHIDVVQLKYDGIWSRVVCRDNEASIFSRTGKLKEVYYLPEIFNCTLVGEFIRYTQWAKGHPLENCIVVFDCVEFLGQDLTQYPYIQRYAKARVALNNLNFDKFRMVNNFRIADYSELLTRYPDYEGIVLRNSNSIFSDFVFRHKRRICQEGYAVAFYEGEGRLAGTLGAIGVGDTPGGLEMFRCGGGFSDELRAEIWANRKDYLNQPLEVYAFKKFRSGSLRHPNFERWKV